MTEILSNEQINSCLVDGKTFNDSLFDIKNMVYYYVRVYYNKWRTVIHQGMYDVDDVAQDMFISLFNKKNKQGLSNIEKRFIEASEKNLGMKYIRNVIGRTVYLNILSLVRIMTKKNNTVSFEQFFNDGDTDDTDRLEILTDKSANIEIKLAYNNIVDGIKNTIYKDFYIKKNNDYKMLSVLDILDMITDGYTITEMSSKVYTNKEGKNIAYRLMSDLVKEVRKIVIESYESGNCLIDLER